MKTRRETRRGGRRTIRYTLSENFLLEKSKELLKINLVFRACLLAESFLGDIQ